MQTDEKITYEISYLLASNLSEETAGALAGDLAGAVEKAGGVMSYSEMPKLRDLAYPVAVTVERKRTLFAQAYLGWMRFECNPMMFKDIGTVFAHTQGLIRFTALREPASTLMPVVRRRPMARRSEKAKDGVESTPEAAKEMEKEIDALIASTEETK